MKPRTRPMYGSASGGHGRMHACTVSGVPPSRLDIVEKESVAALTRAGSACTWPGGRGVLNYSLLILELGGVSERDLGESRGVSGSLGESLHLARWVLPCAQLVGIDILRPANAAQVHLAAVARVHLEVRAEPAVFSAEESEGLHLATRVFELINSFIH